MTEKRYYSIRELAKVTGISRPTVSKLISDNPNAFTVHFTPLYTRGAAAALKRLKRKK